MADYSRRVVFLRPRVEYVLPADTNWTEVSKVFAAARNELGDKRAQYDDALKVHANDEEIVFWFESDEERGA